MTQDRRVKVSGTDRGVGRGDKVWGCNGGGGGQGGEVEGGEIVLGGVVQ